MLSPAELPYLTREMPGIGGRFKSRPEDFVVEELPLYPAAGDGTHVYFQIEKTGLPTMRAVQEIARALGRKPFEIGYAGLKDADAVTRQTLSIEHVDPERVRALELSRIRVVSVDRHRNKLKLGHLAGNYFRIRLRDVDRSRSGDAERILEVLARRGVPNYFGEQRFGMRGDTWLVGKAAMKRDYDEAMGLILGRPGPFDYGQVLAARQQYEAGNLGAAADLWPHAFQNERRLVRALERNRGNARRTFKVIDRQMQRFYLSAYQSQLFNQIVAQRVNGLDRLVRGDLAWRHPQGAVFRVEDPAVEQPRCDSFEISPTGPLYGYRMTMPTDEPGEREQALMEREGLTAEDWKEAGRLKVSGGRRPLRFRPQEPVVESGSDGAGDFIELRFFLEPGCYATTVLREVCKSDLGGVEASSEED